jgi:hypothetical protein
MEPQAQDKQLHNGWKLFQKEKLKRFIRCLVTTRNVEIEIFMKASRQNG